MQMNQIYIFGGYQKQIYICTDIGSLETISVKSVGYRQENVMFGAYFGSHLENANEPHLHINWEASRRDACENLRPIQ